MGNTSMPTPSPAPGQPHVIVNAMDQATYVSGPGVAVPRLQHRLSIVPDSLAAAMAQMAGQQAVQPGRLAIQKQQQQQQLLMQHHLQQQQQHHQQQQEQ